MPAVREFEALTSDVPARPPPTMVFERRRRPDGEEVAAALSWNGRGSAIGVSGCFALPLTVALRWLSAVAAAVDGKHKSRPLLAGSMRVQYCPRSDVQRNCDDRRCLYWSANNNLRHLLRRQRSSGTRSVTVAVHLRLPVRGEPPCGLAQSTVFSVASTLRNVVRLPLSTHMASHTLRSDDNRVSLLDCEHQQHQDSTPSNESANRQRRSCTKYAPRDNHGGMMFVPKGRAPCDMWFRG